MCWNNFHYGEAIERMLKFPQMEKQWEVLKDSLESEKISFAQKRDENVNEWEDWFVSFEALSTRKYFIYEVSTKASKII